jgi:Tol biopolymer transport system component
MVYLDISSQGIVYVYDRSTGESEPVNLSSTGTLDGQGACCPTISEDVRYVAFGSLDDNLAEGGILEEWDVFVHDRQAGTTELVNRTYDGGPPDGASESPVISGDGRYIAFWSWASNLVPEDTQQCENGETTGSCGDIFVSNLQTGTVERVEVGDIRALGRNGYEPSLSADGRFLAFYSQIYDRELHSFESICPEVEPGHCAYSPKLSADGRYVAFHDGDQVFVYDRQTRTARQVSVSSSGEPADRASGFVLHYEGFFSSLDISPDGRWIAFTSLATNLVPGMIKPEACTQSAVILYDGPHCYDLYLHDLETGETRLVNQ